MLVRVVHYFYPGGGLTRFTLETIKALRQKHSHIGIEMVSYSRAATIHRQLLEAADVDVPVLDITPRNRWAAASPRRVFGLPGTGLVRRTLGGGRHTYFEVPDAVYHGCDLVWLPWAHRHRVPAWRARRTLATLHDLIALQFEAGMRQQGVSEPFFRHERETLHRWLTSSARLVLTSQTSVAAMRDLFGVGSERFDVIRILAGHIPATTTDDRPGEWRWADRPFLLCPANVTVHKNHDVLLDAVGRWGEKCPLVLTGVGSHLDPALLRAAQLRVAADRAGLQIGTSLIPVGYVPDNLYFRLLRRAWALVMPTLAEGGGSYPVLEAMLCGIPVLCSDIPVMREQMQETGGDVLWFNPHDPRDLAARLRDLEENYEYYKARAVNQIATMRVRTWDDVAREYERIMAAMTAEVAPQRREANVG